MDNPILRPHSIIHPTRPLRFLPLFLLLFLTACGAGYQQENGQWVFVTYNESQGRVVRPIAGVDSATFDGISGEYARDAQRVYHREKAIPGADPASFRHVGGLYWKDADQVFYVDQPVPGADPESFRTLKYTYWARDDQNVYVGTDAVNPRDLASFRQINSQWSRDNQWYYPQNSGKYQPIAELDYATFEILDGGWAKDCCRVFWLGQVVDGADLATFHTVNEFRARDNAWAYLMGSRQRTLQEDLELEKRLQER